MPILLKSSGTWRQLQSIHLKVNGVWRQIGLAFLKVNGVWRALITSGSAPFIQSQVTISKSGTSTITLTGTNYHWTYFSSGNYSFQTSVDNSNWSTISSGSITNPSSGASNTKTRVLTQGDYQAGATNYYRFTVSVSSTYGNTTTSTSGTVSHVVAAAAAPTITSLTASAPNTSSVQLVTITVNWASTNQASYFLNVLQTGVANYGDYGTTETTRSSSHGSGNNFQVYSGASVSITLRVYNQGLDGNGFNTGSYVEQSISYTPPVVQTVTYGSCETYGNPTYYSSGYICYSDYSYAYTDLQYNQRRQVLYNGNWYGEYDYDTCGPTTVRTYGSFSQVVGQCGYNPVSIPATPGNGYVNASGLVTWDASSGATSYELLYYTAQSSSGLNHNGPYTVTGIGGTSYQLSSPYAYPNNWVRVQVRARNSAGVSTYGSWSPTSTTYN